MTESVRITKKNLGTMRKRKIFQRKMLTCKRIYSKGPIGLQRKKGTRGKHEGCNEAKGCKKHCGPGREGLLFLVQYFWPSKVLHQEGVTGREHFTEQSARDTGDGERKGRGGNGRLSAQR